MRTGIVNRDLGVENGDGDDDDDDDDDVDEGHGEENEDNEADHEGAAAPEAVFAAPHACRGPP